jgi:hypothetical protein
LKLTISAVNFQIMTQSLSEMDSKIRNLNERYYLFALTKCSTTLRLTK